MSLFYKSLIRPLLFRKDPEVSHEAVLQMLAGNEWLYGIIENFYKVEDQRLVVKIGPLTFANPVGLAQIGAFRKYVGKTLTTKATKTAMRTTSRNTQRTQVAYAAVALKGNSGRLVQNLGQYLLGLQMTQEMKDDAFQTLGDIGYDLAVLARVLKVKLPSSTKKSKLVGTRSAALLQFDGLTTDLLRQVENGMFGSPKMTTVKKMVTNPSKGGVKEERDVDVVDAEADKQADGVRQNEMRSFLAGAIDVYWRLCFDVTGKAPEAVLNAKFARMQQEFPSVSFETAEKSKEAATA